MNTHPWIVRSKPSHCVARTHVTCPCGNAFMPTENQHRRAKKGILVYCSRACQPKAGGKLGSKPETLYQLGAFPHVDADGTCVCRRPASHFAVALYRGNIAIVAVCSTCAQKV